MISAEVHLHMQQLNITKSEYTFILPYCRCKEVES